MAKSLIVTYRFRRPIRVPPPSLILTHILHRPRPRLLLLLRQIPLQFALWLASFRLSLLQSSILALLSPPSDIITHLGSFRSRSPRVVRLCV